VAEGSAVDLVVVVGKKVQLAMAQPHAQKLPQTSANGQLKRSGQYSVSSLILLSLYPQLAFNGLQLTLIDRRPPDVNEIEENFDHHWAGDNIKIINHNLKRIEAL
jgi:hypothetical protein